MAIQPAPFVNPILANDPSTRDRVNGLLNANDATDLERDEYRTIFTNLFDMIPHLNKDVCQNAYAFSAKILMLDRMKETLKRETVTTVLSTDFSLPIHFVDNYKDLEQFKKAIKSIADIVKANLLEPNPDQRLKFVLRSFNRGAHACFEGQSSDIQEAYAERNDTYGKLRQEVLLLISRKKSRTIDLPTLLKEANKDILKECGINPDNLKEAESNPLIIRLNNSGLIELELGALTKAKETVSLFFSDMPEPKWTEKNMIKYIKENAGMTPKELEDNSWHARIFEMCEQNGWPLKKD